MADINPAIQIWPHEKAPELVQNMFMKPRKWIILVPATNGKDLAEAISLLSLLRVATTDFYGIYKSETVSYRVFGTNT